MFFSTNKKLQLRVDVVVRVILGRIAQPLRFGVQKLDPTVTVFASVRDQEKRALCIPDVINTKAVRLFSLVVCWLCNTVGKRNKTLRFFALKITMCQR
jgi:hypothetical protein